MTELLTSRQMRAIENAAIASGEVTGLELMERAGQGVLDAILAEWPEFSTGAHRALVLCGPGNNGGDGFALARLLKSSGWDVDVYLYGDAKKLPPDAQVNFDLWREWGAVSSMTFEAVKQASRPDIIVDAVFGIGLTRPLPEDLSEVLDCRIGNYWRRGFAIKRIAVDCPSGLDLDTGMIKDDRDPNASDFEPWPLKLNSADLTVTFHQPKVGHYISMGPALCGNIAVVDLGLSGESFECRMIGQTPDSERIRLVAPSFMNKPLKPSIWPLSLMPRNRGGHHKFDFGHVVVFAGSTGRGGAGRLAARAALRSGAGVVTVLCPSDAVQENACHLTAIMLKPVNSPDDLRSVIDDRVSMFCIGPGLGVNDRTRAMVLAVLALGRRTVLDADALTSFAHDPQVLFDATHKDVVITPHMGEFERLFGDLVADWRKNRSSKVELVRSAAKRAGCIVLLKGQDTVIAQPDGGVAVHAASYDRETPWLATAGAGDVLAGIIAGLGASEIGADFFCEIEVATWLHVECARSFGPGLIAEDLPDELPKVFRKLGL